MTKKMEVDVLVIDMSMLAARTYKDFMGMFIADLVLASFAAENERINIKKRKEEGIWAVNLKGA